MDVQQRRSLVQVFGSGGTGGQSELLGADGDGQGYTSAKFHPDGLILGTGSQGRGIRIWDIRQQQNVASFTTPTGDVASAATVNSLSFSENGYLVAAASDDSTVRIWDLRKIKCLKSLECMSFIRQPFAIYLIFVCTNRYRSSYVCCL